METHEWPKEDPDEGSTILDQVARAFRDRFERDQIFVYKLDINPAGKDWLAWAICRSDGKTFHLQACRLGRFVYRWIQPKRSANMDIRGIELN